MGHQSAIDQLSDLHREQLTRRLTQSGFTGYDDLTQWLSDLGYQISKSSVHRYGQKLEQKLSAVQASTMAAMEIAKAAPDDADVRSQAVMSLIQTELFNAFVELQAANDEDADPAQRIAMLAAAGKGIASIMQASTNQKKWQAEVAKRTQVAAESASKIASKGGLSEQAVQEIRAAILGISA